METPIPAFIPPEPETNYADLSFEDQIKLTQSVKHRILHGVMTSRVDGVIPTDKESVDTMLKVMDSMDRTTIANRRTQIESEGNKSAKDLVEVMAQFVRNAKNKNPFVGVAGEDGKGAEPSIGLEDLGEFEHPTGEGEIGVISETSEEFNERMRAELDARNRAEEEALGLV